MLPRPRSDEAGAPPAPQPHTMLAPQKSANAFTAPRSVALLASRLCCLTFVLLSEETRERETFSANGVTASRRRLCERRASSASARRVLESTLVRCLEENTLF